MNALPGKVEANSDRRAYLRNYLVACLRDNVLAAGDLLSLSLLDSLRETMASDVKDIAKGLAVELGLGFLKRIQGAA
jgi:predicted naringenin-chalcone synthase